MKPILRCSSLDRILACPGSMVLVERVDARDGDEVTHEGTALHANAAIRLVVEYGATMEPDPTPKKVVDIRHSKWIADFYIRHIAETVPPAWSMECEAALAYEFDRFTLSGHIDCVAISPDGTEAVAFDLKTGYLPVDIAENNWQLLGYACLLKRAYPSLNKVTFWIVQPRNDEDDGYPRTSSACLEGERLENALPTLEGKINTALDNQEWLETGPTQCKYCIGCSCPAIREEQKLMRLKLTPEVLAQIKRTPDDATLGDFVVVGRMLSKPLEDAEKILHERLDTHEVVVAGSGTTITRKLTKGSYEITEPVGFLKAVRALLPEDESIARTYKPSVTKLKDEIADKMAIPKTGKSAVTSESVFDAHLRPLVVQKERRILQFN